MEIHSLSAMDGGCFCWWERRTRWTTSGGMVKILETSISFITQRKTTFFSRPLTRGLFIIQLFSILINFTPFHRANLKSPLSKVLMYPRISLMFLPRQLFFSLNRGIISFIYWFKNEFSFRKSYEAPTISCHDDSYYPKYVFWVKESSSLKKNVVFARKDEILSYFLKLWFTTFIQSIENHHRWKYILCQHDRRRL